jgi:alpha-tubulin suppressor-like RCC1 family protein
MKTERPLTLSLQRLAFSTLAALALLAVATVCAPAQTVTISAAEFQRLVYSAHLHTQLAEKPELDASLQVLLALDKRNPHLSPASLAGLLQVTTARYRTNAPSYIVTNGVRDEVLAAYVEALRGVSKPAGFVPADLTLLQTLVTRAANPSSRPQAGLLHSGSQAELSGENDAAERRALLDSCTKRAFANSRFAQAMDRLLSSEIHCSVTSSAAEIIGSPDSPLHGNIKMTSLLASNTASPNGSSLTICSNDVKRLFAAETQSLWNTVHTNLELRSEFNQSQPDLTSYLTNPAALSHWSNRLAEARLGTTRQIACSTAAVLVQSQLTEAPEAGFTVPEWVGPVCDVVGGLATLGISGDPGALISSIPGMLGLFDTSESPDEQIIREIGNIKTMIGDLSANNNYRFNRLDQSLTDIFVTLNLQMEKIEILDARTVRINDSVDSIRGTLVGVQNQLYRIERNLAAFAADSVRVPVITAMNRALGYELSAGGPMGYTNTDPSFEGMQNVFYTHAHDTALMETCSHYSTIPDGEEFFYNQLTPGGSTNVYGEVLNYIKKCLRDGLRRSEFELYPTLANPQDWNAGAGAWLQLALENPGHFRTWDRNAGYARHLDDIISKGLDLASFHRTLTFRGASINSALYTALGTNYAAKLNAFGNQVAANEDAYASSIDFALNPWRPWDIAAPRVTTTNTTVLLARPKNLIVSGYEHSLALKADGTVVGWGDNSWGQTTIPASATNLVSIAAGTFHSLALRADGTVVGWGAGGPGTSGFPNYGQTTIPTSATNVVAIAAGPYHGLALRADGTVVGWGWNNYGQSTVPANATNVVAIAAAIYHSLAIKADGTVIGWGAGGPGTSGDPNYDQTTIPASVTNAVAIAAGYYYSLALKTDGTVIGWGRNDYGQTTVPFDATNIVGISGFAYHSLALRADGTVVGWGRNNWGQTNVPAGATKVVGVAAGFGHSLALKADGTVVGWGLNDSGQAIVRGWRANPRVRNHIAGGESHSAALEADGKVVAWGRNQYNQLTIPTDLTNVIALAAGSYHTLALKADGSVVGWGVTSGSENYGQTIVPPNAKSNVVAVAAGFYHSLVLRADGTVFGWGGNSMGQITIPAGLGNVVAISAGARHSMALKADGTVAAWGWPQFGQTAVPTGLSNVVAIAAGYSHSVALKADGTIVVWGDSNNTFGNRNVPAGVTNVVAIAASAQDLALKADGTVVAWGWNDDGQANVPTTLNNVVAIAAGGEHSLAIQTDGTVVGWGVRTPANNYGQATIPTNVVDLAAWGENPPNLRNILPVSSPITQLTAGSAHSLALAADGSVVAWGLNTWGQVNIPPQAQSGVQAVAAGLGHSLVLTNGGVFAWGLNDGGQATVPPSAQSGVVAISAGGKHNLALKHDGTVVAWGLGGSGQTNVPTVPVIQGKVVAIAAGGEHSLALDGYGTVWAWGGNRSGQTTPIPDNVTNIVAIAAGRYHNLALTYDGQVRAWGLNSSGQCNVPDAAHSGVVAIAAGINHSLAVKADGTAIVWGSGPAAFIPLQDWSNVVAIAAGDRHSILLSAGGAPESSTAPTLAFTRARIPVRVVWMITNVNAHVVSELGRGVLHTQGTVLSGAKALIQAVLQLGMPYTLERDDVLRGFLFGSEPLVDLDVSGAWLQGENDRLQTTPGAAPLLLSDVAALRHRLFTERLNQCLANLRQPETPRLVGHTLRLLNLLRDAWAVAPPPVLELRTGTNALRLVLYGEPFAHYTLQYRDDLTVPGWTPTGYTGLHNEESIPAPVSTGPRGFYRALLPQR